MSSCNYVYKSGAYWIHGGSTYIDGILRHVRGTFYFRDRREECKELEKEQAKEVERKPGCVMYQRSREEDSQLRSRQLEGC